MKKSFGIHWFRRDLRVTGNHLLFENIEKMQGRTIGVFCFDSRFLSRPDFSNVRFAFFLQTLKQLKTDLDVLGIELKVFDALAVDLFKEIYQFQIENPSHHWDLLTFNTDYEPFAVSRDKAVLSWAKEHHLTVKTGRDHLILEPNEVLKPDGSSYQIFTPFAKNWLLKIQQQDILERLFQSFKPFSKIKFKNFMNNEIFAQHNNLKTKNFKNNESNSMDQFPILSQTDQCDLFLNKNQQILKQQNIQIPIPPAGYEAGLGVLKKFHKKWVVNKGEKYKQFRDFPALSETSGLSIFLKNGSLTSAQVVASLLKTFLKSNSISNSKSSFHQNGFFNLENVFLKEIIWREFYYSILFYNPHVESQAFQKNYQNLPWENNKEWFSLWQAGRTGFPIVDAGMRQLIQTGWMHNRVRMIVASFLTKDLLIDYRWGEQHFMNWLLDGDLAANNGGWQWAASTGCDAQPYFRIFNPWLQSAKFDPDGEYIKKYIPELKNVSSKNLHNVNAERNFPSYPRPMVDHAVQKNKAIRLFKIL